LTSHNHSDRISNPAKKCREGLTLKRLVFNLRFRTRLALVMFLTMACMSAVLMVTYVSHNRRVKAYVAGQTSDLLQIIQLAQTQIPPTSDRNQALRAYLKALKDAGVSNINMVSPSGQVVDSTNPGQVGKKIKLKKRHTATKEDPIKISAELHDVDIDPSTEQKPYVIEFPIVQGDKVLGYAQIRGEMDAVGELLRRIYMVWLAWILATMLAGIFAAVYLAFLFTKPVDMLVDGAQQVASGNLYVSLPVSGSDEMGRLAQTFNQMVERLRENRELQERLNEAEKTSLLGRFAATVAHEVRNSLNFINLSIDQIRVKHSNGDERSVRDLRRNLGNIKDEINRLNKLVNDFLAAGRQMPPQMAPCDLKATLGEALALVEKQARRQNVIIASDLPADLPTFHLDAGQMKTCFLNILTNAIQAMPRGGHVHITATSLNESEGAGSLQLRFADTGPGIPREDRERVFASFYSTKATGFGLGLAITKKIMEDHRGRVYVSEGATPGTVIVLELPFPRPSIPQPAAVAASPIA
jgi:signal transduction histidine kinase